MSQPNTLPDRQTAFNTLFQGVHARVFMQKCAQAGIQPRNRAEAEAMLETAYQLRAIKQAAAEKQAAAAGNLFFDIQNDVRQLATKYGLDAGYSPETYEADLSFRSYAQQLAQDPEIYNATLALKVAEAQDAIEMIRQHKAGNQ